jgi:hypothetical protein
VNFSNAGRPRHVCLTDGSDGGLQLPLSPDLSHSQNWGLDKRYSYQSQNESVVDFASTGPAMLAIDETSNRLALLSSRVGSSRLRAVAQATAS